MRDIIKHAEKNSEFVQLEDGFWYYWPKVDKGAISEYDLYCLFEELKERNKKWNDYINEHFRTEGTVKE